MKSTRSSEKFVLKVKINITEDVRCHIECEYNIRVLQPHAEM